MSKTNILMVSPRYRPYIGGVERHVEELAGGLVRLGHQVTVLTARTDSHSFPRDLIDGVEVIRFRSIVPIEAHPCTPQVASYMRRNSTRYGIIHYHHYHSLAALFASLSCGDRVTCFTPHYHGTGHTPVTRQLHRPYKLLGRLVFDRSRAVICVSHAEAAAVSRDFPAAASRIQVIPNGIDASGFARAEAYPMNSPQIVCVGRLEEYKNVEIAIRALAALPPEYELTVVGEGSAKRALADLASQMRVRERVRFTGRVDDDSVRRWTKTASVFMALSSQEAFGMAALEARAAGVPVVASAIPAHQDVLGDSAEYVDLESPTLVADVVARVAGSGAAAPPHLPPPDWDEVAGRTSALYHRLVEGGESVDH